jgi:hypothetical protein
MSHSPPHISVPNLQTRGASGRQAAGIFEVTLSCRAELLRRAGRIPGTRHGPVDITPDDQRPIFGATDRQ